MEWVETTGRTVEEAKEYALDQLGVDEIDAEFEVLEEPKVGLFGRMRSEARVRARVRPQAPPPKQERRERRGRKPREDGDSPAPAPSRNGGNRRPAAKSSGRAPRRESQGDNVSETREPREPRERPVLTQEQIDDQQAAVRRFLDGLLDAFGLDADVEVGISEDEAIEARIEGDDVGLLVGPRGAAIEALQELARRALQQHTEDSMRLRVDVGGYRERRREALARFAQKVAAQVLASGEAASLEPMNAADRKVVHDTVNDIEGVRTSSEGEEPRRGVVISPE